MYKLNVKLLLIVLFRSFVWEYVLIYVNVCVSCTLQKHLTIEYTNYRLLSKLEPISLFILHFHFPNVFLSQDAIPIFHFFDSVSVYVCYMCVCRVCVYVCLQFVFCVFINKLHYIYYYIYLYMYIINIYIVCIRFAF